MILTRPRRRWLPLAVLIAASTALLASIAWAGTGGSWRTAGWGGYGPGMPMMSGPLLPGAGPVGDLAGAADAARRFADPIGLRVGEVMRFSNGYYAELVDADGNGATEVLVDPDSGAVQLEWGPAMMWNTDYGMMPTRDWQGGPSIEPAEARRLADRWLQRHRPGLRAGQAEPFPGYYTVHTVRGDQIAGMLSVHAGTGVIWYHTWHGSYLDLLEPTG